VSPKLSPGCLELPEQPHDSPLLVRMHPERVDQVGEPLGVLGVLVEQPARERVPVGLVCDQVAAEQLAASWLDRRQRELEIGVIHWVSFAGTPGRF
jgi:hypothetical protein